MKAAYCILGLLFALAGIAVVVVLPSSSEKVPLHRFVNISSSRYWGAGAAASGKVDETIRPFKVDVPESVLADLKSRLNNTRYFDDGVEGFPADYGISPEFTKD